MLTITDPNSKVATVLAIDIDERDLLAMTVPELAALQVSRRDAGGMWVPIGTLQRTYAFALKSVQRELFGTGAASLGYGISAAFHAADVTL